MDLHPSIPSLTGPATMPESKASRGDAGRPSRRTFIKSAGAAGAAAALASAVGPTILKAEDKAGSRNTVIGKGEHTYECFHNWGELPAHIKWGETHGVAIDEAGLIYIKHRNRAEVPMDAIAVFDPAGKFVRSFGKEYHAGSRSEEHTSELQS